MFLYDFFGLGDEETNEQYPFTNITGVTKQFLIVFKALTEDKNPNKSSVLCQWLVVTQALREKLSVLFY